MRSLLKGEFSMSFLGVVLRTALKHRPSPLGSFTRLFPCCALKAFHRAAEVMPLPLPRLNEKEQEIHEKLSKWFELGRVPDEAFGEVGDIKNDSQAVGAQVLGLAANLGPLTLEAILPTTPLHGQAGRVDLASVVSPELKPYVEEPGLLRIDEEVTDPRTSAEVQVESQEEWNKIATHLVKVGMLEREVDSETIRFRNTLVKNGMFGVHKKWVLRKDGTWLRTLRLIVNLIPSNGVQRRLPFRASERMGYAPLWGNLVIQDDEIILCSAEDQKNCFHMYRPGYKWRAFFVLNRKASGSCFGDGKPWASCPRVITAPMGWSNIVDFIQDGFEHIARAAGLPPERVIRMNEPSPCQPLSTPRTFYSFYVDNYDELMVVWRTDKGEYEGRPTDSQLKLRREMDVRGIARDPDKAAEGQASWASLGAEVDGQAGWIGSSLKFHQALAGANMNLVTQEKVRASDADFESVVSKNMHSVQYARPLACLFDTLYGDMAGESAGWVSEDAMDELLLQTCL